MPFPTLLIIRLLVSSSPTVEAYSEERTLLSPTYLGSLAHPGLGVTPRASALAAPPVLNPGRAVSRP